MSCAGELAPGSIALFYRPRGTALLISLFTKSPYYHVAIVLNNNELIEALPRGVVRTAIAEKRREHFYVIPPPSNAAAQTALKWAESKLGDGYDPADLIAIACDRIFAHLHVYFARKDRFTCGEFVATAYDKAGHALVPDADLELVVPADFEPLLARGASLYQ